MSDLLERLTEHADFLPATHYSVPIIREAIGRIKELVDGLTTISETASHGNLHHSDAPDNCAKIAGIAQGLLGNNEQPMLLDKDGKRSIFDDVDQ